MVLAHPGSSSAPTRTAIFCVFSMLNVVVARASCSVVMISTSGLVGTGAVLVTSVFFFFLLGDDLTAADLERFGGILSGEISGFARFDFFAVESWNSGMLENWNPGIQEIYGGCKTSYVEMHTSSLIQITSATLLAVLYWYVDNAHFQFSSFPVFRFSIILRVRQMKRHYK